MSTLYQVIGPRLDGVCRELCTEPTSLQWREFHNYLASWMTTEDKVQDTKIDNIVLHQTILLGLDSGTTTY